MSKRRTTEQFIAEARAAHAADDRYDYSKVEYKDSHTKVEIICPKHGSFHQSPTNHLRPCGCPGCTGDAIRKGRGFNSAEFDVARARAKHGDKYDYSNCKGGSTKTKVEIICPEHGLFLQSPEKHYSGSGCPECKVLDADRLKMEKQTTRYERMKTTFQQNFAARFIEKARIVHGEKYNYDLSEYTQAKCKIEIVCPEHGSFWQTVNSHLNGNGCPACQYAALSLSNSLTSSDFIAKATSIHGDKYDYSKVEYRTAKEKVEIVCLDHGSFWQQPNNHLSGNGCPECTSKISKQETELFDFIKTLAPDAEQSDRTLLAGKELDIVVPSRKLAFEFNGLWWHSERMGTQLNYHQDKTDAAAAAGYRLIHIFSDEWENHRAWCEAHIRNVLNVPARIIYARKCEVEQHESAVGVRQFLEENHLQGFRGGRSIVLKYDGEIVACAIVSKTIYGTVELARWCVKLGLQVVGGFSKVTKLLPAGIISYCDTSKYDGSGYEASGWTKVADGQPSYHYTDGIERVGRQHFQKHKLLARGAVGENEVDLAASEGFYRIGGCRQLKFALR